MWSMKSAAALAVGLWALMLIYLAYNVHGRGAEEVSPRVVEKLSSALDSLKDLEKQNRELKELIQAERKEHAEGIKNEKLLHSRLLEQIRDITSGNKPKEANKPIEEEESLEKRSAEPIFSKNHEIARRRLDSGVWEIFYFLHKQMRSFVNSKENKDHQTLGFLKNHTENQLISLLGASAALGSVDDTDKKRVAELQKITDKIQAKINEIQNPIDCTKAKALVCTLDKECGFGCQLHHVAYCFVVAFGEGRMMILKDDGRKWRYSKTGWTGAFLPITKCSYDDVARDAGSVSFSQQSDARIVNLGIVDGLSDRPPHLPLSFPRQLADELQTLHSNPSAFFISQFIWYLMRNGKKMSQIVAEAASQIPFGKTPVAGLQVRRTDKVGTEAAYHSLDEYMEWTEIWFKVQERKIGRPINRTVYIASDDPEVVPEAKKKYPQYTVFGDTTISQNAQVSKRYTDSSLAGVVTDINLLSMCDYLVCTFSSQVCRMGYELMQVLKGEAGESFHSLDDLYYYGGQFAHEQVAIEDHIPENKDEIELKIGDTIGIAGNHWDGYSKGNNRRTQRIGLYPSYKAVEKWRIVNFPALG